jgi:hypothetical protein
MVEVRGDMPQMETKSGANEFHGNAYAYSTNGGATVGGPVNGRFTGNGIEKLGTVAPGLSNQNASVNVMNLQRRVAGVLPVAIDVPRAGTSFSFVRPLVLDEETKVTFSYKSR